MRNLFAIGMCILLSACSQNSRMGMMMPEDIAPTSEVVHTTGQAINDMNGYRVLKQSNPELFILQRAQEINQRVNDKISYAPDDPAQPETWRVMTAGGNGNCNDYAVTKLREMVEAGVPRQTMRLTVASVNNSNEWHLMLAVDIPGRGTYFMDSNRENVLSVREARQLYTLWFMENPIARRMELVG